MHSQHPPIPLAPRSPATHPQPNTGAAECYAIFLSVVLVVRNQGAQLADLVDQLLAEITPRVGDLELILVDNASDDDSLAILKTLTSTNGRPNLQVYALTQEVQRDTAAWVGLENALGDFVAVVDPLRDSPAFLPAMIDKALKGVDLVFANNRQKPRPGFGYRVVSGFFQFLLKRAGGVSLSPEAPYFRVVNRRVINFVLQHTQPALTYRHLSAMGGFSQLFLDYSAPPSRAADQKLGETIDRDMHLLLANTRAPMRLVTSLSLFGAGANLVYSLYVVAIALFKSDVAPGWTSLSLQQSGMFFLISLVLLVLGEYILHMASLSGDGPLYHVAQEFSSAVITRRDKLNVETVAPPRGPDVPS